MDCPIHYGAIALEAAATLPCGHVFCHSCITTWLSQKRKGECPICKIAVTRRDVLRLYVKTCSPSPTKKDGDGGLSALEKRGGQQILKSLENLCSGRTSKDLEMICIDMDHFTDVVVGATRDMGTKCLADEIKCAAVRFQSLILPELRELEALRTQLEDSSRANADLSLRLQQQTQKIEAINHQNNSLKQNIANLHMAKSIADNNCSAVRQKLEVAEGKLVDAEGVIRAKDDIIGAKEEQLIEYRRWLGQNRSKVERLKKKLGELECRLNEYPSHEREEPPTEVSHAEASFHIETEDAGKVGLEASSKRRRVANDNAEDLKLEKSCFMRKPKASFQITKRVPQQHKVDPAIPGLNVTNGRVKGLVSMGPRARMGKNG